MSTAATPPSTAWRAAAAKRADADSCGSSEARGEQQAARGAARRRDSRRSAGRRVWAADAADMVQERELVCVADVSRAARASVGSTPRAARVAVPERAFSDDDTTFPLSLRYSDINRVVLLNHARSAPRDRCTLRLCFTLCTRRFTPLRCAAPSRRTAPRAAYSRAPTRHETVRCVAGVAGAYR